jgi:hypothetical protein
MKGFWMTMPALNLVVLASSFNLKRQQKEAGSATIGKRLDPAMTSWEDPCLDHYLRASSCVDKR